VRFGEKHCFCIYKTLQPTTYNGGVVVVSLNQELQCQRCKYFTTPRVAKRVLKTKIFYSTLKNALIYVLLRWRCGCEVVVLAPSHTAYRLIYTYNDNGFARKKDGKIPNCPSICQKTDLFDVCVNSNSSSFMDRRESHVAAGPSVRLGL
jgi:hypothetical protein